MNFTALLESGNPDSLITTKLVKEPGLELFKDEVSWMKIVGKATSAQCTKFPNIQRNKCMTRWNNKYTIAWVSPTA